jgi:asparagine synthase (glutamine-hydrolysing)
MGFGVPMAKWLRGELSGLLRDVLLDPRTIARGVLKRPAVESLITDHANGRADNSARLYALMFLETWWRKFVDG